MKTLIGIILLIPFFSLAQIPVPYNKLERNIEVDTIYFNIRYSEKISAEQEKEIERLFEAEAKSFNYRSKNIKVKKSSSPPELNTITVSFDSIIIATRQQQTMAVLGSAVGIALPVMLISSGVPIFAVFIFSSTNRNFVNVSIADNLLEKRPFKIRSSMIKSDGGWFRSSDKNTRVNNNYIGKCFEKMFNKLDRRLK